MEVGQGMTGMIALGFRAIVAAKEFVDG